MPLLYKIGQLTVGPAVKLALRPTVEGIEHVPASGGAVLAGNHLSVADEYVLGSVVPRHIAFWAKAEYLHGTGVRGWAMKSWMTGLGAIEVNRDGGRAALSAHDAAIQSTVAASAASAVRTISLPTAVSPMMIGLAS